MPIFEYRCEEGHITEQLFLNREEGEATQVITCEQLQFLPKVDDAAFLDAVPTCNKPAERIISSTVAHFVEGIGGFHKPSIDATSSTHSRSGARDYILEAKEKAGGRLSEKEKYKFTP